MSVSLASKTFRNTHSLSLCSSSMASGHHSLCDGLALQNRTTVVRSPKSALSNANRATTVATFSAVKKAARFISVCHLESRTVLGPRLPMIVDPRSADIGVAEPFLHLGNVGLMIERVGCGGRAQRMRADLESQLRRISPHQLVNAVRRDCAFGPAGAVVADGSKQRTALIGAMTGD